MAKKAQKRRQRAQRLLEPLLERLRRSEVGSTRAFLETVQQWLADNLDAFPAEARTADGLAQWASITKLA